MKIRSFLSASAMASILLLASCSSIKQVPYFTDLNVGQESVLLTAAPIKLQPGDKISILVSTSDARLNSLFNLPVARNTLGSASNGSQLASGDGSVAAYTVDSKGDIQFPVLGRLHVSGMTREELSEYLRSELISRDLAKNPIVTVDFLNLQVTVLGDVSNPGRYPINREEFTILDAIGAAGDLSITGLRDNIKVLREENGVQRVYEVNINEAKNLTKSPVYYLRQNDVVYVEPNKTKMRTSTPNGNSVMTPGFWISLASFGITIATLTISLTKK
ncbi:MAG: polysaccharide export protein [Muribaculaceae bacterium]|nr:polysaccharide export protein [Muribaculaceae bacterium]